MTLAEGLEAKELREALRDTKELWGFVKDDLDKLDRSGHRVEFMKLHDPVGNIERVISRPKSSYEQEAELMEVLVKRVAYLAAIIPEHDGEELNEWARTFANGVKDKLEALYKFREERRTS